MRGDAEVYRRAAELDKINEMTSVSFCVNAYDHPVLTVNTFYYP